MFFLFIARSLYETYQVDRKVDIESQSGCLSLSTFIDSIALDMTPVTSQRFMCKMYVCVT